MTPEQRANLDPHGEEYRLRVGGSKNQIAGWVTYTTLLWALKTCMLIFYSRLTYVESASLSLGLHVLRLSRDGVKDMRMRIRVGAILLGVTYLATVLSILLGCQPFHRQWQINPDPGSMMSRRHVIDESSLVDRLVPACHFEAQRGSASVPEHSDGFLLDVGAIACKPRIRRIDVNADH